MGTLALALYIFGGVLMFGFNEEVGRHPKLNSFVAALLWPLIAGISTLALPFVLLWKRTLK